MVMTPNKLLLYWAKEVELPRVKRELEFLKRHTAQSSDAHSDHGKTVKVRLPKRFV